MFWDILKSFQEVGLNQHMILIGSWAELVYQESDMMEGFKATTRTFDLDFLIRSRHKKFSPPYDVPKILEDKGFNLEFSWPDGHWKFDYFEEGVALYIEFLVPEQGKGSSKSVEFPQYNLKAHSLRDLDILMEHAVAVSVNRIDVMVPAPGAYVLQKMVIHKQRQQEKQEKDARAIEEVFYWICKHPLLLDELRFIYEKDLTAKQRIAVDSYCSEHGISF